MKNRTGRLATVRVAFATPSAGEAQKRDAQASYPGVYRLWILDNVIFKQSNTSPMQAFSSGTLPIALFAVPIVNLCTYSFVSVDIILLLIIARRFRDSTIPVQDHAVIEGVNTKAQSTYNLRDLCIQIVMSGSLISNEM